MSKKDNIEVIKKEALSIASQMVKIGDDDRAVKAVYDLVSRAQEMSGINQKTSCSSSCSNCCHDIIYLSTTEARFMKPLLRKANPNMYILGFQNKHDFDKLSFHAKGCSLLDENRNCSIYENRPMICRTHNSTEDPKYCNRDEYPDRETHELYTVVEQASMFALLSYEEGYTTMHELLGKLHLKNEE